MIFKSKSFHTNKIYSILFVILFTPSFVKVSLETSSMAQGVFLSALYTLAVSKLVLPSINYKKFALFLTAFVLHFIIICFRIDISIKYLLSFLLILLILLSAAVLSIEVRKLDSFYMLLILKKLSLLFIFTGCLSIFWSFPFLGYEVYHKPVFPFSEPSHFAIGAAEILFVRGLFLTYKMRIFFIFIVACMAIGYPSTTLLFILYVMIFFYFISNKISFVFMLCLMLLLSIYIGFFSDSGIYFLERLNFFDYSTNNLSNLSNLSYVRAWEDLFYALDTSLGLGVGFQNMETLEIGEKGTMVANILANYNETNRNAGGFLAAKIIAEFGILGIILILSYLLKLFKSAKYIINFVKLDNNKEIPVFLVFGHAVIVIFSVEMFGRCSGYFSSGIILLLVSIFLTSCINDSVKTRNPYIN